MAATIPCPACGTDNSPDAVRCHVCDYELHAQLPGPPTGVGKCPRCGSGVAQGAGFCQVCGQSVDQRHARPHTGALNVRAMFGDQGDAPMRAPVRQFTEIAPSAQAPSQAPTFAPPGGARAQPQAQPAAPYMAASYEEHDPVQANLRDNSAPRGRRRPAPRPRPNYAGFDSAESGQGDLRRAGAQTGYDAPPSIAPDPAAFAPVYADGPPRAHAPPRPHVHGDPVLPIDAGASANNLPRPRNRPEAHPEPVAPRRSIPDTAHPSWGSPQPQPRAALRLVLVGRDGQEGESFPIPAQGAEIGRAGVIAFPSDPFVSPQHARVTPIEGGVHLADLGSRNGVYLRLNAPTPVYPGDFFLLGNQLLRLDRLETAWQERPVDAHDVRGFGTPAKPPWAVLTRICVGDIEDDRFHLRGTEITIGREQGEIVFPSDGFLSRAHARVRMEIHDNSMSVVLEDLDSANGTYLRIRSAVNVPYGGMFRVGDQIFRLRM
jgi:pSer/pThr/pTyr-binding forkhead associated (FHA) protein